MKKQVLSLLLIMSSLSMSAQQTMSFQTACHPADVKHYDTQTLRDRFVMEKVMEADQIHLTYSMYDRFIFGGAMPVNKDLKLETHPQLRADYFMRNRELGIINTGGDGVVIVDGQEYPLGYSEALYVGRGWLGKDKNGKDIDSNKEVIFRSKNPQTVGEHEVSVPDAFFKVVLTLGKKQDAPKSIGFIYNNVEGRHKMEYYVRSVDEVEKMTGLNFFSHLDDKVENRIEAECDLGSW